MKKNLSANTIRKMRRVIKAVLAEPEYYDQSYYPQKSDCGLVCCAAGWTVWLDNPDRYKVLMKRPAANWWREAEAVLGLPDTGNKLFVFAHNWPTQFWRRYIKAKTPLGRAKAMAARWEHFIATDGAE